MGEISCRSHCSQSPSTWLIRNNAEDSECKVSLSYLLVSFLIIAPATAVLSLSVSVCVLRVARSSSFTFSRLFTPRIFHHHAAVLAMEATAGERERERDPLSLLPLMMQRQQQAE